MLRFVKVAPEARLHYLDLLLIGDEDPNMLRRYLDAGTLFAAIDETVPVGVAMVVPVDATTIELKNLAVLPARPSPRYWRELVTARRTGVCA